MILPLSKRRNHHGLYQDIGLILRKQTGLAEYGQQQLQSKLSYLKTKFVRLMVIKNLSGIGWCGITSFITNFFEGRNRCFLCSSW